MISVLPVLTRSIATVAFALAFTGSLNSVFAQEKIPSGVSQVKELPLPTPISLVSPVQDKNFYVLSLLERTPGIASALASNGALQKLATQQRTKTTAAFKTSETDVPAAINAMMWTPDEIETVVAAFRELYQTNSTVRQCVDKPLRQSGMYVRYNGETGDVLFEKAWRDAANGMNNMLRVYGLGTAPRYPLIDSVAYQVDSPFYKEVVNLSLGVLVDDSASLNFFFHPTLRFALALMDASHRDEAGRFEPMEKGENRAALQRTRVIEWSRYPYSVILVPGQGPDEPNVALSPKAKLVLSAVAKRYRIGQAPFIVVSGGYVHPNQTPYCEAVEMKKSLMADFDVPENAIIIDPHARHTTTNMRNASRLIYRYGIPFDKQALVTTTIVQATYIDRKQFEARCNRELGYQPHQIVKRLSQFDIVWLPRIESLQIDPTDPLDP